VRQKIADYLIGLGRMGVAGFRIDAAKHMQPVQLDSIISLVNRAAQADGRALPYWFAEVIDNGGEAVTARDYWGLGHASGGAVDVTEFKYRGIGDKFIQKGGTQKVSELRQFSEQNWQVQPSDKAVVFVENHDTQRGDGVWYRDGQTYRLANVWLLGHPYGYPSVMSSYAFDRSSGPGRDAGPPSDASGATTPVRCAASLETAAIGDWVCEHRDPVIRTMVRFRKLVAGTDVNRPWDNGGNAVAFSRGDRGFVAISREASALTANIPTGLAAGTYCDLLTGGRAGAACAGTRVTVDANGTAALTLPANSAVVLHVDARL
jgi:alpha-amylase